VTVRAVRHINCATMRPLGGPLVGARGLGRGRMVAHCLVVETARDGVVLVETGFGTRDIAGATGITRAFLRVVAPALDPSEPAIAQLAALGYAPADVRHVVVTHLDVDHAGGLADFPHARVHVHAREHAAAMARASWRDRERYMVAHWQHGPAWEVYDTDGDTWRGLPAIARLRGIDADIGLVPLHGHTRGHSAVIVRSGERWLVHAGDAYFKRATLDGGRIPLGFALFERADATDNRGRLASVATLRRLRDDADVDIFCAHDPAELDGRGGSR
jgi:glyoxylase-like metal-dependent hydrolase (beta-lactamase superfamily II)